MKTNEKRSISSAAALCSDRYVDRLSHAQTLRLIEATTRAMIKNMDALHLDNIKLRRLCAAMLPFAKRNPSMRRAIAAAMRRFS